MRILATALMLMTLSTLAEPPFIQYNPYTTTTNKPSVTVAATQPLSIITTNTIGLEVTGLSILDSLSDTGTGTNTLSKLSVSRLWIDPRNYGAYTTNADNTATIQAALNIAQANGGGIVRLPSGVSVISSTLTVTGNVELVIEGTSSINNYSTNTGSCLVLANGANCDMFVVATNARCSIKNILFDGNKDNQATPGLHGIWLQGDSSHINRETIENVIVQRVKGIGILNDNRETRMKWVGASYNDGDGCQNRASSDVESDSVLFGFNGGNGVSGIGANAWRMSKFDLYRNATNGLYLYNCNNNEFVAGKADANEQEGGVINSGGGSLSYRNHFIGVSFNNNNFYLDHNGNPTSWPSGSFANFKVTGDNSIEESFVVCNFWESEGQSTNTIPKMGFEDARGYYITNSLQGYGMFFAGSSFRSETNWFTSGAYSTNLVHNAHGDWFKDFAPVWNDQPYFSTVTTSQERITDQLEADIGVQANAFFNSSWKYRADGPAYYLRMRRDNPILGLQYAVSGLASNALTWITALNVNSTNGYVAVNNADTPALSPLEVIGNAKATSLESASGSTVNAYFDGGWKYRANGAAFYLQTAANGIDDTVLNIALAGTAGAALTWIPMVTLHTNGTVAVPATTVTGLATAVNDSTAILVVPASANGPNYVTWYNTLAGSARGSAGFANNGTNLLLTVNNGSLALAPSNSQVLLGTNILSWGGAGGTNLLFNGGTVNVTY